MKSIQSEIREWHESVFGDEFSHGRVVRTAKKTLEEAAELYVAAREPSTRMKYDAMMKEVADVAITCYALACVNGVSLDAHIRDRLAELRERTDQRDRDRARGIR